MGNMGMAESEMQEKLARMREEDVRNGHSVDCGINDPSVRYCTCGKFPRKEPEPPSTPQVPQVRKYGTPVSTRALLIVAIILLVLILLGVRIST